MSDSGATAARPVTGGRLADAGLLRPIEDRKLAGVCAGLGRITGTDALLWRVVLATLMVLYGAGLALYLIGWLFMPSEGDSASAMGALLSRKRSSVPKAATALLFVAAVPIFFWSLAGTQGRPFVVFGLLLVTALLLSRRRVAAPAPSPRPPGPPPPPPGPPSPHPGLPPAPPAVTPASASMRTQSTDAPAPHDSTPAPVPAPPSPEPSDVTVAARPRSVLGLVLGSLIVIAVSVAAMARLSGAPVRMDVVFALGMLACGAGLLVAAWWGRARGLILLGLVMLAGMTVVPVANALADSDQLLGDQRYRYEAVDEIPESLRVSLGRTRLDMSAVDFGSEVTRMRVSVLSGAMEIEVPRDVDVVLDMNINGTVQVDGDEVAPEDGRRTFDGDDSAAGALVLTGGINAGSLEVNR